MADLGSKAAALTVRAQGDLALETDLARATAELDRLVQQTLGAAREWGVRPDQLEGRFISALLSTLGSLGSLTRAAGAQSLAASREHAAAASAELKGLQAAMKVAAAALQSQAQNALAVSEVQVERVVSKFVLAVAPEIVEQVRGVVVLRERRCNQSALWGRAAAIAGLACALVLGGYTWRAWTADPVATAATLVLERVRQCQATPAFKLPQTGEALCNAKALLAGS